MQLLTCAGSKDDRFSSAQQQSMPACPSSAMSLSLISLSTGTLHSDRCSPASLSAVADGRLHEAAASVASSVWLSDALALLQSSCKPWLDPSFAGTSISTQPLLACLWARTCIWYQQRLSMASMGLQLQLSQAKRQPAQSSGCSARSLVIEQAGVCIGSCSILGRTMHSASQKP